MYRAKSTYGAGGDGARANRGGFETGLAQSLANFGGAAPSELDRHFFEWPVRAGPLRAAVFCLRDGWDGAGRGPVRKRLALAAGVVTRSACAVV